MINLCITLLPNDRVQAIPDVIGNINKPIPVIDRVYEVVVSPKVTIVSTDSNILFRLLYFLYLFFCFMFLIFEVCNHFFHVVDMVNKTVNFL